MVVNPTAVTVAADAETDNTPTVTMDSRLTVEDLSFALYGFIDSAIISSGKLVTRFTKNTSETTTRSGYVHIRYTDPDTGTDAIVKVGYTQQKKKAVDVGLLIAALYIRQNGWMIQADFRVMFRNNETSPYDFAGLSYTVVGLDENDNEVFTHSLGLPTNTVAPGSEIEQYSDSWSGDIGASTHYLMTVRNGATLSDSQTMAGDDSWIIN